MVCSQKVHLGRRNTCSCLLLQVRRSCTNCDSIHGDTAVLRTPNWAATLFDNSKFIGSINGAAETLFVWICLNCARSSPNWRAGHVKLWTSISRLTVQGHQNKGLYMYTVCLIMSQGALNLFYNFISLFHFTAPEKIQSWLSLTALEGRRLLGKLNIWRDRLQICVCNTCNQIMKVMQCQTRGVAVLCCSISQTMTHCRVFSRTRGSALPPLCKCLNSHTCSAVATSADDRYSQHSVRKHDRNVRTL